MNGWIKLYRDLIEKPIWKCSTPEQKVILITLLCMANHDTQEWEWQGKRFKCKPGQMVTSLESIAKACGNGVSGQNVRTAIKRFEKYEFLTNQSTKTGRLITIVNWEKYQVYDKPPNKDTNNDLTKTQQSTNKDLTTNKNDKNDKNDKKDIYISVPDALKPAFMEFADMRKTKKKPITTENTVKRILNKLDKFASCTEDKIAILNQSTDNCWTDVYELKEKNVTARPAKNKAAENLNDFYEMIGEWAGEEQ